MLSQPLKIQPRRFTLQERKQIQKLKSCGKSVLQIAKKLGRGHSALLYELGRCNPYNAKEAHATALEIRRSSRIKETKLEQQSDVLELVVDRLQDYWSPEQISAYLNKSGVRISYSAIYSYLYKTSKEHNLTYFLRTKRSKVKKRSKRRIVSNPPAYLRTTRQTEWESDTMYFAGSKYGFSVEVHTSTKEVLLSRVRFDNMDDKAEALKKLVALRSPGSITFDQREENQCFITFRRRQGIETVFTKGPHDKPLVEHTVGLLRDFLPYHRNPEDVSDFELDLIAESLNNRPRKKLGWMTPREMTSLLFA